MPAASPRFVVYRAKDGWRWRFISGNGRIVAESGEAYTIRANAERAAVRTVALMRSDVEVEVLS